MSSNSGSFGLGVDFDVTRFQPVEAKERFIKLKKKEFIREQGFRVFLEDVENLGWGDFATKSPHINETIVREFCANMRGDANNVVWVRGKSVMIHEELINSLYGLNKDAILLCAGPKISQLKHFVPGFGRGCLYKGSKFIRTAEKDTCYNSGDLIHKYKTWYHIICSRLMPNTLDSRVTKERTCILYRISCGGLLNPGRIIRERMLRYMTEMEDNDIPFKGLITKLCEVAEVGAAISDAILQPLDELKREYVGNLANIQPKRLEAAIQERLASINKRKRVDNPDVHDLRQELECFHEKMFKVLNLIELGIFNLQVTSSEFSLARRYSPGPSKRESDEASLEIHHHRSFDSKGSPPVVIFYLRIGYTTCF